jgi:prepilin-type N-terminal cleavage/methylation domain-containing protein
MCYRCYRCDKKWWQEKENKGFTLLEVLASMLIMMILIVPLYFQLGRGLASQEAQDELFRLTLLAKRHVELLRSEYEANNRLISRETIFQLGEGQTGEFHWQVEWELLSAGSSRGLYQVVVRYYQLGQQDITAQVQLTTRLMGELP